jgi:wyosine [tRNA(Phe)-imidazoG37] synthetase (radical SAM superfamily)
MVNERKDYFPPDEIVAEVAEALATRGPGQIDWVTFAGSGEPLLHARLGWMIRRVKEMTDLPIAVITNGSLLYLPEVRDELTAADAVLPTLDAGTPELYRRIDRPHPEASFERLVKGLARFSRGYRGSLWVETMLVRGLNDGEEALRDIAARLEEIRPDEIHLNLPTRPPAEPWLEPPDEEGVMRAIAILERVATVRAVHPLVAATLDLSESEQLLDAVVAVIARHPLREDDLVDALARWSPGRVREALARLAADGRARVVTRYGARFWTAAGAFFPDAGPEPDPNACEGRRPPASHGTE